MPETVTTIKKNVVRRLLIELDDTGTYTVEGDVFLAGACFNPNATLLLRLSEQAQCSDRMQLSQEESKAILATLDSPPEPNDALRKLMSDPDTGH